MGTSDLVIDVEGLVKRFPVSTGWRGIFAKHYRLALDGVSLTVHRGEVFGVLGPNGAGKTTLMKTLATLVRPNGGTARVNGLDVTRHGAEVRRCIGMVYGDERTFFWRLSVRENLRFYGALYRVPGRELARRIDHLLDVVGLTEAADNRMYHFSTGMKQRAAIARGLLSDPEILFMDEPTRSLDPAGVHDIWKLVSERILTDGKRTVLLCTNNMEEAEELCGRVALINHGAVQLMGTIPELGRMLLTHNRYRLEVSGLDEEQIKRLASAPGVKDVQATRTPSDRVRMDVALDCAEAAPSLVRRVVESGGSVWSCAPHELSLDEIFQLTVRGEHIGRTSVPVGPID